MNRKEITEKITGLLEKKLEDMKRALKETEISVKQAPSAMESHSDTSEFGTYFTERVDSVICCLL